MIVSPPLPWGLVPVGAVALIDGVPRTVLIAPGHSGDCAWLEGMIGPYWVGYEHLGERRTLVQLASLDETDAIAALAAAGLNPEVIDT